MADQSTPSKSNASQLNSPEKRLEDVLSPTSKRSADFDLYDLDSYFEAKEADTKRARIDDVANEERTLKIADLKTGEYNDAISFRVVLKTIFEKEEKGEMAKTFRFHGFDGTGEISVVVFKDMFQEFDSKIQMNSCVTLTNFKVVPENPKFPTFTGHDYTIRLTPKSDIVSCLDELPQVAFNFCSFEEIESRNVEDKIDLLGVVGLNWGYKEKPTASYREITITDGKKSMRVTLWGATARDFGDDSKIVVALRRAVVSEYQGIKCINTRGTTQIWKNPILNRADELLAICVPRLEKLQQDIEERKKMQQ